MTANIGWTVDSLASYIRGAIETNPDAPGGTTPDRIAQIVRPAGVEVWNSTDWLFRLQRGELEVAAGETTASLDVKFGELDHRIMFTNDNSRYGLMLTKDPSLYQRTEDMNFSTTATGPPAIGLVQRNIETGVWEVLFAPTSDAAYTFRYWYLMRSPWEFTTMIGDGAKPSDLYWPISFDEGWRLNALWKCQHDFGKPELAPKTKGWYDKWLRDQREENDETIRTQQGQIQDHLNDFSTTMSSAMSGALGTMTPDSDSWYSCARV